MCVRSVRRTERAGVYPSLVLQRVARLDLAAASGIRRCGDRLYVIADDELALGVYSLGGAPLGRIALIAGALPEQPALRKASKPDFEALVSLPDGSLLALGSGSTPQRTAAVRIELARQPRVRRFELAALYAALARELPELNIEGGAVLGDRLWLCSRGNSARRDDALIELELSGVCAALAAERAPEPSVVCSLRRVSLGELEQSPLSLTDLSVVCGRLVFTAAAEASPNTYDDGHCTGSVVGRLSTRGEPEALLQVLGVKLEGVCAASAVDGERELLLVADADDRASRAPLFRARPDWVDG